MTFAPAPPKRCVCSSPDKGAYSVCRRCGGEYGFTPPKKRTHGQCTCGGATSVLERGHWADCPALYPLQPQPGDNSTGPAPSDQASRIERLEQRLKDCERAAVLTADHQSRALLMGQQQGRAELATELLEGDAAAADRLPMWAYNALRRIAENDT